MNGRTDLVKHIEHCELCQQRQDKIENLKKSKGKIAGKIVKEIEDCYMETEIQILKEEQLEPYF